MYPLLLSTVLGFLIFIELKRWSLISFDKKILLVVYTWSAECLWSRRNWFTFQGIEFQRFWFETYFFCSYLYNVNEKARHDLIWTLISPYKKFRWGISKSHLYRWHLQFAFWVKWVWTILTFGHLQHFRAPIACSCAKTKTKTKPRTKVFHCSRYEQTKA